jgi:hypothetical protein
MDSRDEENRNGRRKGRRRARQNWRAVGWELGSIPWRQEPLWRKLLWIAIFTAVVALSVYFVTDFARTWLENRRT